ncbi:hypothetical protein K431DRAFT_25016 [Polychaeton citri CBS 116435]|uniref:Uncharacterized protein n=1 Tax=Polychaeton citri CBS 116435 TaxID=1314669 RepID=A0A9P4UKG7_9PEZI|nr:hypothetical protein K431DRAFT_25016 [Polychaeton citri CBS 116435]
MHRPPSFFPLDTHTHTHQHTSVTTINTDGTGCSPYHAGRQLGPPSEVMCIQHRKEHIDNNSSSPSQPRSPPPSPALPATRTHPPACPSGPAPTSSSPRRSPAPGRSIGGPPRTQHHQFLPLPLPLLLPAPAAVPHCSVEGPRRQSTARRPPRGPRGSARRCAAAACVCAARTGAIGIRRRACPSACWLRGGRGRACGLSRSVG